MIYSKLNFELNLLSKGISSWFWVIYNIVCLFHFKRLVIQIILVSHNLFLLFYSIYLIV